MLQNMEIKLLLKKSKCVKKNIKHSKSIRRKEISKWPKILATNLINVIPNIIPNIVLPNS